MTDSAVADHSVRADQHYIEGEVILRVEVSATGHLISVTIARSSGNDILDQAALLVVRHWRFSPATRGGEPIAGTAEVPIWSRLDD
jgi:protein TonB